MQEITYEQLGQLLDKLTKSMQLVGSWSDTPPPPSAFLSNEPFCIDTMSFDQWLQYVFIGRFRAMINNQVQLPTEMSLVPMAEEVYKAEITKNQPVIDVLAEFDSLFVHGDKIA